MPVREADTYSPTPRGHGEADASSLPPGVSVGAGLLALTALGIGFGAVMAARRGGDRPPDMAPARTRRSGPWFGDKAVVGRTVTINRPREELYRFWREHRNLARFMENVESVEETGDTLRWVIAGPAGTSFTLVTRVVDDRPGELIAWRSTPESEVETQGRVAFRDAPAGRGTEVEAIIAYKPPAGELGRLVAKLFGKEPAIQARRELKRFKMLMETGEIATSSNRRLS